MPGGQVMRCCLLALLAVAIASPALATAPTRLQFNKLVADVSTPTRVNGEPFRATDFGELADCVWVTQMADYDDSTNLNPDTLQENGCAGGVAPDGGPSPSEPNQIRVAAVGPASGFSAPWSNVVQHNSKSLNGVHRVVDAEQTDLPYTMLSHWRPATLHDYQGSGEYAWDTNSVVTQVDASGAVRFAIYCTTGAGDYSGCSPATIVKHLKRPNGTISADTWYHFAQTCEPDTRQTIEGFIDGAEVSDDGTGDVSTAQCSDASDVVLNGLQSNANGSISQWTDHAFLQAVLSDGLVCRHCVCGNIGVGDFATRSPLCNSCTMDGEQRCR